MEKWIENFEDYLKSAMSYTNSRNLEEFKETEYVFITQNALNRYYK
jgi:isopentenyl diphosphate isomerase/L-lactate dehydrogenase-like FMN-dependent dehydrogenase